MLTIEGEIKEIQRIKVEAPKDGVHRIGKDGCIKGCRSVWLGDKLIPRGMTGFYWHYDQKPGLGIKVFYSLANQTKCTKKAVEKQFDRHRKLFKAGLACEPHKIMNIALDLKYFDKEGKSTGIHTTCFGIQVDHVFYPEDVWEKYANGHPYDFSCLDTNDHPEHTPDGYKRFVERIRRVCISKKIYVCGDFPVRETEPPKLGDVVYCINKKRWFLVDVG